MTGTVSLVEDHPLLGESVARALRDAGVDAQVVPLGPPAEVVARCLEAGPGLVLLDLDLGPVTGSGVELVGPLVEGGASVLVVTAAEDVVALGTCLDAGALGVVPKSGSLDQLVGTVTDALDGRAVMAEADREAYLTAARDARAERGAALAPFARLTEREAEVLDDLMEGTPVAAIATAADVSEATVRTQVRAVLTKLGVCSQLAAVAAAHRTGWRAPRRSRRAPAA